MEINFVKCPHGGDENVEYFIFLMTKFVNKKYRHLYKQLPFANNPLDTCFDSFFNGHTPVITRCQVDCSYRMMGNVFIHDCVNVL